MLNPSKDRLNYGKSLHPPNNYELDFAIGTTYSLDFDALMGASISLDLFDEMDSNLINDPIFLLKELRKTSNKIALFCENGQIILPDISRKVYILLEDMVFPVLTSKKVKKNSYASFHPKFWLIKYKNEENVYYRVIVLSRNLTFDRSWDVSFVMDGKLSNDEAYENEAIISFLKYLMIYSNPDKAKKIDNILKELKYVHFDLNSDIFSDFKFFVNGICEDKYSINNESLFNEKQDKLLIISPFLSERVISKFNDNIDIDSNSILISRANSLDELDDCDYNRFEVYNLKDAVVRGEFAISEDWDDRLNQDIHAKMYACEGDNSLDLYLGSLNASCKALKGNVELMIKLRSKNLKIDQIVRDLFNGDKDNINNPFELFEKKDVEKEKNEDGIYNLIVKKILRLKPKAKVIDNGDFYNIEVEFSDDPASDTCIREYIDELNICPLFFRTSHKFSKNVIFENLKKLNLSKFFIISINGFKKVIEIPISGMPKGRYDEVISEIIKEKSDFIQYIALLLGDDDILDVLQYDYLKNSSFNNSFYNQFPELYEKMLKASVYNPEKFEEIDRIVKALSDKQIVPEDFNDLYNTFLDVINK